MKIKFYAVVVMFIIATIIVGCSKKPPQCSDEKTLILVRSIIFDHLKDKDIESELGVLSEQEKQGSMKIEYPLATELDEKIKKYNCTAKLVVEDGTEYPLVYFSQLDDKNDHVVSVSGFSLMDKSHIEEEIIKSVKKRRAKVHSAEKLNNKAGAVRDVKEFVKVQDFRQRFVHNDTLGRHIRIVEGTVLNQSDFSIARIMIKVELLDSDSDVLNERVSYAGNNLTDQELSTLSEEEIMKRLSKPEGRNNLNERVIPNGQITFMLVFTKDPPGTYKTSVIVSGAERLLEGP